MISQYEPDGFPVSISVRPAGETGSLIVVQAQVADETAHQHPEKCFGRRTDRIMPNDDVPVFVDPFDDLPKLFLTYRAHHID
jgi:hypothetical protein